MSRVVPLEVVVDLARAVKAGTITVEQADEALAVYAIEVPDPDDDPASQNAAAA